MNDDLIRAGELLRFFGTEVNELSPEGRKLNGELTALAARLDALAAGMGEPVAEVCPACKGRKVQGSPGAPCYFCKGKGTNPLPLYTAPQAAAPRAEAVAAYPCAKCGTLRTAQEGGKVFTVCDTCWDVAPPADQGREGWKLMPVEPTAEMELAFKRSAGFVDRSGNAFQRRYAALLSAAPIPPSTGESSS